MNAKPKTFLTKCLFWGILLILTTHVRCVLTTFQSPAVLEPDQRAIGVGASVISDLEKGWLGEFDIYGRTGINQNLDAGFKYSLPLAISGDLKYQILSKPILFSADLGVSYGYIPGIISDASNSTHFIAIQPMLLAGSKHIYGGIKSWIPFMSFSIERGGIETDVGIGFGAPAFFLGASIGDKLRILPEANFYLTIGQESYDLFLISGIGLQYVF